MKRLYESSLGRLELELDSNISVLSAWLFDADGAAARKSEEEWNTADAVAQLHKEIGLPEPEAQSIAASFVESARGEGHPEPRGAAKSLGL